MLLNIRLIKNTLKIVDFFVSQIGGLLHVVLENIKKNHPEFSINNKKSKT